MLARIGNDLVQLNIKEKKSIQSVIKAAQKGRRGKTGKAYYGKGRRVIDPKTGDYKYVYVKGAEGQPKEEVVSALNREIKSKGYSEIAKVSKQSEWHQKMMPTELEYDGLKHGSSEAAADYLARVFWSPQQDKEGVGPSSIVKSIPKSNMEGYDAQDMNQELALRIMEIQKQGKLANVPKEKFPAYIATVYKNLGHNLAAKRKADRETANDISDMADAVEAHGESVEMQLGLKEAKILMAKVANLIIDNATPQQARMWKMDLNDVPHKKIAQKLGVSLNQVDLFLSRGVNKAIDQYYHSNGMLRDVESPGKYLKPAFKKYISEKVFRTPSKTKVTKARIVLNEGKLLLFKAGGEYTGPGVRTGTPGNYKYYYGKGGKPKPGAEEAPKQAPGGKPEAGKPEAGKTKTKKQYSFKEVKEAIKKSLKESLKGIANILAEAGVGGDTTATVAGETGKQSQILGSVKRRETQVEDKKKKEKEDKKGNV
jgi:DNA-directed RNA polymerase specialized sigma24 family protein